MRIRLITTSFISLVSSSWTLSRWHSCGLSDDAAGGPPLSRFARGATLRVLPPPCVLR
ncbi:hypothetical protein PF005_g24336 [Phytophthora fragariae]|uniref:RxLR effector protein n=1 Tax=Phytophthora fragariae TaxID=53985 RepID=A0A6A4C3G6_9STRA|nr:hypothetical protein PF003_g15520 [Phytophthora fragariae]KAE8923986.1 hypothetical protein PF009_g25775 [Phytophthora fragariae]KAE9074687.1 hypothetical protein PF010_g24583 [Phytophthora fragariae]KAE9086729.1 hypothetical protein PF007_g20657 [Phytophthora fragariae]KAE9093825.1 hypothetical protein PF006_g24355 [Phytophthora fragariae]